MNHYLNIHPEVSEALHAGKPVVALESTIISHGMPYPQNVETARAVEQVVRDSGAIPANHCHFQRQMPGGSEPGRPGIFRACKKMYGRSVYAICHM